MNRTPLAIVAAALFLALGFFALGMLADSDPETVASQRAADGAFAGLPSAGARDSAPGVREEGGGEKRRRGANGERGGERQSLPGRARRDGNGVTVVGSERDGLARGRGTGAHDSTSLSDLADDDYEGGSDRPDTDRIPGGLAARPGNLDDGDARDRDNEEDPQQPDAANAPVEGVIFEPFAPQDGGEARGPEEQPYLVDQVDFDDENGVLLGDDSVLTFPTEGNVKGESGTIDLLIEPDWDGGEESTRTILRIDEPGEWNNRLRIVKDNGYLRYMFFDNTGAEVNINVPIDGWEAGEPHQITASWGDSQIALFLDGQLMAEKEYTGELILDGKSRLDLGSKGGDGYVGAGGRISDLTVYDRVLTPDDF